jgi:5-deoxy-glucuronate isomerase
VMMNSQMAVASPQGERYVPEEALATELFEEITDIRVRHPEVIEREARRRKKRARLTVDGKLAPVAADHPGRGVTKIRDDQLAMGDRYQLIARLRRLLEDPNLDGILVTSDLLEEQLILSHLERGREGEGFLDGRLLVGSMNRGGLSGTAVFLPARKRNKGSRCVGRKPHQLEEAMSPQDFLVHSRRSEDGRGNLLSLPREAAGWEWLSFFVHRLAPGQFQTLHSENEELAIVLLGGKCVADWGEGQHPVGDRAHVFDGLPYTIYLPAASRAQLRAETACEFAECRVPSTARLTPQLIRPKDVKSSLRGGGNASRQIVDVMPPDFPADKLMVVEVYTPGGNWSSYPPHKHDVHNPPTEVDLDEIYYYRMDRPGAYAHQRLYVSDGRRDLTLTVRDGDVVLVRDGYHPVVAGHGYNIYYLNCLAGSARQLATTEDPDHVWVRSTWNQVDPRVPMVRERGV